MKAIAKSKINLFLRVVRKRKDGYHEIETIFLPLDNPCDTVSLDNSRNGKLEVTCSKASLSGPDNLCYKAAEAFAKSAKIKPTWKIHVTKRIPLAAGLGGGSSDAAAVLRLLQKKYPNKISEAEIFRLASKIGADVPFFLNPVSSFATGIGEKLKPLPIKCRIPIVVVFPRFPVSAKWAYQNRMKSVSKASLDKVFSALEKNDPRRLTSLRNDLAPALWRKFPFLAILKDDLLRSGSLGVEVSGSGSSLFAIAKSSVSAERISKTMNRRFACSIRCFTAVVNV